MTEQESDIQNETDPERLLIYAKLHVTAAWHYRDDENMLREELRLATQAIDRYRSEFK